MTHKSVEIENAMPTDPDISIRGVFCLIGAILLALLTFIGLAITVLGMQIGVYVAVSELVLIIGFAVSSCFSWLFLRRVGRRSSQIDSSET
ncbi:MAG: hypothetical protein JWM11_6114 [Planctomycetaceae bacterium]|nr:hypothetical protein [Planctomycetaceae bacterium]